MSLAVGVLLIFMITSMSTVVLTFTPILASYHGQFASLLLFHVPLSLFWASAIATSVAIDWKSRLLRSDLRKVIIVFVASLLTALLVGYFTGWGGLFLGAVVILSMFVCLSLVFHGTRALLRSRTSEPRG